MHQREPIVELDEEIVPRQRTSQDPGDPSVKLMTCRDLADQFPIQSLGVARRVPQVHEGFLEQVAIEAGHAACHAAPLDMPGALPDLRTSPKRQA
jgi:hypothetical protein